MARTLVKDQAAEDDLIGIWVYSFNQWSESQADRYLSALEAGIKKTLSNPEAGKRRESLREGYWSQQYRTSRRVLHLHRRRTPSPPRIA